MIKRSRLSRIQSQFYNYRLYICRNIYLDNFPRNAKIANHVHSFIPVVYSPYRVLKKVAYV